jgi:hypothetical protein
MLAVGAPVAVTGELSFKDTETESENGEMLREGKILVKKVVPVKEDGKAPLSAFEKADVSYNSVSDEKGGADDKTVYKVSFSALSVKNTQSVHAAKSVTSAKTAIPPLYNSEGKTLCLYLKLSSDDSPEFERVKHLLEIFSYGKSPVFIHFTDVSKTVRLSGGDLALNGTLLELLSEILSEDNVKTAYRKV